MKLALTLVRHKPRVHTSDAGTVAASTAEEEHVCLQVRAKLPRAYRRRMGADSRSSLVLWCRAWLTWAMWC